MEKSFSISYDNDSGIGGNPQVLEFFDPVDSDNDAMLFENNYGEKAQTENRTIDTDSESDSDLGVEVELVRTEGRPKRCCIASTYKKRCAEIFSVRKLACLLVRRTTDCLEGFVSCVKWVFDCAKFRPGNVKKRSSGSCQTFSIGARRACKLLLDRKVSISVLIYGIIAFLENIVSEVRSKTVC